MRAANFRETFVTPLGREAVRAFLVFGVLLAALTGIAAQLSFRELSLKVLLERIDLGRIEARQIAQIVTRVGQDGTSIDFSRVRAEKQALTKLIRARLSVRYFIHHVEVVDRFGVRQLLVANHRAVPEPSPLLPGRDLPADWPVAGEQIVTVPLEAGEGAVRLGVSAQPILDELAEIRSSLRRKVAIAAVLALILIVSAFFYVLHLIRKNRRLEQSRQSAERASYVGVLASGLAHEIRNPLNAMNMNLQMLEEELQGVPGLDRGDWGELLESTNSEIKRLEGLVNNFLSYARPARPTFASRDLNAVVGEVVRFLEGDFRQSQVELRATLEPLLPAVELDQTLFRQALINLLVNARQVLQPGGRVDVRTRAGSRGDVVVEVEDDGPGIPEEVRERVFEIFYSSRGGGTGLGLPIARQIIESHGGQIEMRTVVGQGTRFSIHLPRKHETRRPVGDGERREASP